MKLKLLYFVEFILVLILLLLLVVVEFMFVCSIKRITIFSVSFPIEIVANVDAIELLDCANNHIKYVIHNDI